ncbi:MAG: Asp-tRNA(Asn)/Glu-tRNA(Gln) amidotransferase subunit GatB [Dehalococcoidia bacterium]|nr:MAG: Asp-tRNA(Asn)/Glu-tRNA(Gln) amidotransferase subunit GatB [Dehalococcoidia bacterium]
MESTTAVKPVEYETVIGLEVHAQLRTASKMYCRCSSDYASAPPNTHVCPVCLGMPGVLPNINRQAVEYAMMTALALNCAISDYTKFDRKNYPYPDLMKGYQISQYDQPVGTGGWLNIEVGGEVKRIGVTRVHQEEDVAKLLHRDEGGMSYSLVDVNRSGVPLMEIVSEPDMRSAEEARAYLVKLHSILRYLGVSTANMEEGSFRCDANISIRPKGSEKLLAKVEVKNMNSFRAVFKALEYEGERQRKVLSQGGRLAQETRGWVEAEGKTVSQRSKEFAHDYRYFPEPDLPPVMPSKEWIEEVRSRLPELPEARMSRFMSNFGLPAYDANLLTESADMADYYESLVYAAPDLSPKEMANWLVGPAAGILNTSGCDIIEFSSRVSPDAFAELVGLVGKAVINAGTAKSVLEEMFASGKTAQSIIDEKGLAQISDMGALEAAAEQVIKDNPQAVADYKAGKAQAVKFMVGQLMRLSKGRANPNMAAEIITRKLGEV